MGVEWKQSAIRQRHSIFSRPGMTEADWDALAQAVARVREGLAANPLSLGKGREAGRRVWFTEGPSVGFQVLNDDDVVVTHLVAPRRDG